MEAKYWANKWFSGTPVLNRTDADVNFGWGEGEIIPGVASNYVSVEWSGFLLPTYSEAYTFVVHVNDGVKVWVGETVVIDSLVDVSGTEVRLTSTAFTLSAGVFTPLRIQYYEATGTAFIALYWQSTSQTLEILPTTSLYYWRSHVPIASTSTTHTVEARFTPRRATALAQGAVDTYKATALTLVWSAPTDTGC